MFWRKADPQERQPVLDLLKRLSNASHEIDRAADAMKQQFARMDNLESAPQVISAIDEMLDTVENVREETTEPGYWPVLKDATGAKKLAETLILREEVFKHQMWRLKSNRDLLVALSEGRANEEMNQEANKAERAYEKVLNRMSGSMIKLGKRYGISVLEFAQL